MKIIPIERVCEVLVYDPETGLLTRKSTGKVAGCVNAVTAKYITVSVDGVSYLAHRLAWAISYGEQPADCMDHINRIRHDNRLCNLRKATPRQNCQNMTSNVGTTGYRGVWKSKRKDHSKRPFRAEFRPNGKGVKLGYFETAEEAGLAYQVACERYYGEYAYRE